MPRSAGARQDVPITLTADNGRTVTVQAPVSRPAFDPERSDVDFLVEYLGNYDFGLWLKRYFHLKDQLEAVLERPVDLVMTDAPRNRYFAEAIDETRQLLYAA